MQIVVVGCGYVGHALATAAARAGHNVWGTRRSLPEDLRELAYRPVVYSFGSEAPPGLPPAIDVLYFCAAANERSPQGYRAVYVDGLQTAIRDLPPAQRVIFTSSTSVYHQRDGEIVNETSQTLPKNFTGEVMLAGEQIVTRHTGGIVARVGGIYGPGRNRFYRDLQAGTAELWGQTVYTNRIHREDLVATLLHLAGLASPDPLYNLVDSEPASRDDILLWAARQLGMSMPPRSAGIDAARPPRPHKRVSNERLLSTAYKFIYPTYREGLPASPP